MKKSFNKKLSLKKTDIATLSDSEMKSLVGGYQSVVGGCGGTVPACATSNALCTGTCSR